MANDSTILIDLVGLFKYFYNIDLVFYSFYYIFLKCFKTDDRRLDILDYDFSEFLSPPNFIEIICLFTIDRIEYR